MNLLILDSPPPTRDTFSFSRLALGPYASVTQRVAMELEDGKFKEALARALAGNPSDRAAVASALRRRLIQIFREKMGPTGPVFCEEDAEDFAHDVLQKLLSEDWRAIAHIKDLGVIGAWLRRSASNHLTDQARLKRHAAKLNSVRIDPFPSGDGDRHDGLPDLPEPSPDPATTAVGYDEARVLKSLLAELKPINAAILLLRLVHDVPSREMPQLLSRHLAAKGLADDAARAARLSENAIDQRVNESLRKLREILKQRFPSLRQRQTAPKT